MILKKKLFWEIIEEVAETALVSRVFELVCSTILIRC